MEQKLNKIFSVLFASSLLAACSSAPETPEMCIGPNCTLAPKKATSRPYQINGVWYHPQPHYEYEEIGVASYYGGGDVFHGRPTATGAIFNMNGITAAHKTLPLPCIAEITNLENNRQIQVEINDRGPFIDGRIIDVSRRVAQLLGFEGKGTAKVKVRTLVPESLALNGIGSSEALLAQAEPLPPKEVILPTKVTPKKKIDATLMAQNNLRLPDSLFEDKDATAVVVDSSSPSTRNSPLEKSVPSKGIFVHVGGYADHSEAIALSKKLNGFADSQALPVKKTGSSSYAVQLGPLLSMAQANQVLDQLVNAGHLMSRIVILR